MKRDGPLLQRRITQEFCEPFVTDRLNFRPHEGSHFADLGEKILQPTHPREVFREAIAVRAAAIVLFHNHPSGDPWPSPSDIALTRRLMDAGRIVGIEVVDHLILADTDFVSMRKAELV